MAKNAVYIIALSLISIMLVTSPNLVLAAPVIHINTNSCGFEGPDGPVTDALGKIVVTQSKNGNILLICNVDGVSNVAGKAFVNSDNKSGELCGQDVSQYGDGSDLRFTNEWELTVSASGHAKVTCHFKN